MGRITEGRNRQDGDDEINCARPCHEAEALNQDSPDSENAEGNREIFAQLRVPLQHVARGLTQGVPDAVGLHIAGEKRRAGRERAEDHQGQGGVAEPDASRGHARDEIDQYGDEQQRDREVIGDRMKLVGLQEFDDLSIDAP